MYISIGRYNIELFEIYLDFQFRHFDISILEFWNDRRLRSYAIFKWEYRSEFNEVELQILGIEIK